MTDPTLFSSGTAAAAGAETARGGTVCNGAGRAVTAEGEHGTSGAASRRRGHGRVPGVSADSEPGTVSAAGNGARPAASPNKALAQAADLLDALVVTLRSVGGELLEERLGLVGRCEARMASVRSDTVAELARRDGEARAADAVRERLGKSRRAAKGDVKLAGRLADLPGTADALAGGAITPQHARIIAEASEHTDIDEAELLGAAESEPTDTFGRTVRDHVNERSAGEDPAEIRRRQRTRREVSITRRSDGMYKLFGLLDPVAGARVETALAAEARKLRRSEDPQNRATPAQRSADALERLVTRSGTGKAQSTTLLVTADYDVVAGQLADAQLVDGTPLSAEELIELALEAKILPALFDTEGQPLWLGREQRDAGAAQRIALAARDRGCVGCAASHNYCQPHHIKYWEHGGTTDLDNLCLLCNHCHHRLVHTNGARIVRGCNGKRSLQPPDAAQPPPRTRSDATSGGGTASGINHPLRR